MSSSGSKIVFIIQSCEGSQVFQKAWGKTIRHSVLRILHSFDLKHSCNAKHSESVQLKWAYKFVNTGSQRTGRIRQELKDFTLLEFSSFEDEVSYLEGEKNDEKIEKEYFTGGARILREELMSVVHDYEWEDSNLISPIKIKKRKKLTSVCGIKIPEKRNDSVFNSIIKAQKSEREKPCQNIVVLISAIPTSHDELNSYFEWHVEECGYVADTLMPSHLRSYFKEKHNIKLLWINNGSSMANTMTESSDRFGIDMMKKFVTSIGGFIIPISLLCSNFNLEKDIAEPSKKRSHSNVNGLTMINLSKFLKLDKELTRDEITVHICRKIFLEPHGFHIQKFLTVSLVSSSIESESIRRLLRLKCSSCCSAEEMPNSNKKAYCQINSIMNGSDHFREIQVSFINPELNRSSKDSDVKPETVLMVYGYLPHCYLSFLLKNNFSMYTFPMWCEVTSPNSYTPYTLVVKLHKYCTLCGEEPCIDHCGTSRYAVLQFISRNLAFVMFMSSLSSRIISNLVINDSSGWMDQAILPNQPQIFNNIIPETLEHMATGYSNPKPFTFSMMENLTLTNDLDDVLLKDESVARKSSIQDDVFNELQTWYKSKACISTKCEKQVTTSSEQQRNMTEFDSVEAMVSALRIEYNKAFEAEIDTSMNQDISTHYCGAILQVAQTISSVVLHHARLSEESRWKESCEEIFTKYFYCTANDIRKRTVAVSSQRKLQESILQVLLRLELVSHLQTAIEDLSDVVDEICFFLRLISLSISPVMMTRCLEHVFVENHSSTCGELLCEVHNELMQPIPDHLKSYCTGMADESCEMSVVNSVVDSAKSSVSSYCSLAAPDSNSRKPMRRISSFPQVSRQIEVPSKIENKRERADKNDNIKDRLRSSSKKPTAPTAATGSKEVGRVKRDLFSVSNEDKPLSNKTSSFSIKSKQQRRMSVSDTPDAKQRMTAFSRQRLRLHREKRAKEEMMMIIEESPAKLDDIGPTFTKTDTKSPRHKVMLSRRHSFYCDGNESRTVARAKVLKQHHEAAPSTPFHDKKKKDVKSSGMYSPNTLLFSQNHRSFLSPAKSNILICDDSPAKNTRSHATKALFQSPKQKDKLQDSNIRQSISDTQACTDILSVKCSEDVFIKGIQPIAQSPFKTPRKSSVKSTRTSPKVKSPFKLTKPHRSSVDESEHFCQISKFDDVFLENNSVFDSSASGKVKDIQRFPDILAMADSTVITKTTDPKSQTTLDGYVIRTPRSCSNSNEKPREMRKRKWSLDSTPTRDDINQWPRKKRGVDKSSPGIVSKKGKKIDNSENVVVGTSSSKNLSVMLHQEKDTNENIVSPEEFILQPKIFDTLHKFEFQSQNSLDVNLSKDPQKLSARSLLHIQNSPILTPGRLKQNQKT